MKENSMSEAMEEKTGAAAPEAGVRAADAGQEDMPGTAKQEKSKPGWDELIKLKGTNTVTVPIRPRRCDHMRIRLEGKGMFRLFSVAKIISFGSDM